MLPTIKSGVANVGKYAEDFTVFCKVLYRYWYKYCVLLPNSYSTVQYTTTTITSIVNKKPLCAKGTFIPPLIYAHIDDHNKYIYFLCLEILNMTILM